MIGFAFRLYAVIAILSPWIFLILRSLGIYDFKYDSAILVGLFTISAVVGVLTYKPK